LRHRGESIVKSPKISRAEAALSRGRDLDARYCAQAPPGPMQMPITRLQQVIPAAQLVGPQFPAAASVRGAPPSAVPASDPVSLDPQPAASNQTMAMR
jgi:hypothetical protein